MRPTAPLLAVEDLAVTFPTAAGNVQAVRGVSFSVEQGEALAVVGESGSGKSVTMLAVLGLLPSARVTGSVRHRGTELVGIAPARLREIRGARIAMVFQDPMTSLNPVRTIGSQLSLVMRAHNPGLRRRAALGRAAELLELVAIPQPGRRVASYPHELSGGMRQRVMIAMAMANSPEVLIADEPTTALDVTVQAQILEVLDRLRREQQLALVLITHDLGVVAGKADRVAVMYAGRVVEQGAVQLAFRSPQHPYTKALIGCLPRLDRKQSGIAPIGGAPPSPVDLPSGCPFHPRCPDAFEPCRTEEPPLLPLPERQVACYLASEPAAGARP